MIKSFFYLILIINILILFCGYSLKAQLTFHEQLTNIASDNQLVGMSVVTMCNGMSVDEFYYGLADIDRQKQVTGETYYRIASISKAVTATALMMLYDEGLFDLNDNINEYLDFEVINPNYPNIDITFSMLLSHTSSLVDGNGYSSFLSDTYSLTPPPNLSELICQGGDYYTSNMWLNKEPGSYFTYSNVNYGLIGTLIEQISGKRFDLFVRERILQPLEISGSFNIDHIQDIQHVAVLYRNGVPQSDNYGGVHPELFDSASYQLGTNGLVFAPQGGLRITARDLAKFMAMHANNGEYNQVDILSESTAMLMHQPVWTYDGTNGNNYYNLFNSWGLGLQLTVNKDFGDVVLPNVPMIGHAGEAYGLISDMYFEKEKQFGIVFITNGLQSGSYEYGNSSAFYLPEEQAFDAVNEYFYQNCNTLSTPECCDVPRTEQLLYYDFFNHRLDRKSGNEQIILSIYDLRGTLVGNATLDESGCDVSYLPRGFYLVKAISGNQIYNYSIVR